MRAATRRIFVVLALSFLLPAAGVTPVAAADGSTTILVLDVSGSMSDPARIPPDFPQAARLKERQDAVGRLVELAHPGQKVPLSVIAGGLLGLPDLLTLRSSLDDYLKQHNVDPMSISKLAAMKSSAAALLSALQFERDHAGVDDRAGVVTFGSDAAVLAQPTPQLSGLVAAIQGLDTDGSTNMGAGLQQALDLLGGQPNPSVILLTDGWNNEGMTNDEVLSGPVGRAVAGRVPVCTIGLGETPADVDQRLLRDIASRTGGGYHFVGGASPLGGDLLACHHSLAGQSLGDQRGTVRQGQVVQGQGVTVPAGRHRLAVTLSWPGSQLDLRVADPSGRAVGPGYPGASVLRGGGLAALTVTNPAPGHWATAVAGVQTAAGGEPFVVSASTDGTTSSPARDSLVAASAPLDQVEQRLRIALYVSAAVAGVLVVLWFAGLVRRMFRRRGGGAGPARPAAPGGGAQAAPWQPVYPPPASGGLPPSGLPPGGLPPSGLPPGGLPPSGPPQTGLPSGPAGYVAPAPGAPPAGYVAPTHAPVPPGYAYAGAQGPALAPPRPASRSGGCLGCLGWLLFVVDVLVLGGSAGALYLWTTPLLTFPG